MMVLCPDMFVIYEVPAEINCCFDSAYICIIFILSIFVLSECLRIYERFQGRKKVLLRKMVLGVDYGPLIILSAFGSVLQGL